MDKMVSRQDSYSQLINGATAAGVADEPEHHDFESLDYDTCENDVWEHKFRFVTDEESKGLSSWVWRRNIYKWILAFGIGVLTALVAFFIDYVVKNLMKVKFDTISDSVEKCMGDGCLALTLLYFLLFNLGYVAIAGFLTVLVPVAAGSGIPEIKCYLNGVKIPGVVRLKTLVSKAVGVLFSVAGGMMVGKEGPMIHSGAIIAAGVSQGRSTSVSWINTTFRVFRNDRDKRDFVSGGAAAGVAAAFGAPIGGVLFSLEEGSSFWNQSLTWRTFFCSMASTFTLNIFLSGVEDGEWGKLSSPGLINFGKFENGDGDLWTVLDLVIFIFIGVFGGLCGAIFNEINKRVTIYRLHHINDNRMRKFGEVCLVAMTTTIIAFIASMQIGKCVDIPEETGSDLERRKFFCGEGQYNDMATLAFNPQEAAIKELFHEGGQFSLQTLGTFFLMYLFVACWTYGTAIPSGLFVPCICAGAAYGRFVARLADEWFPGQTGSSAGTYALIGAASFLGGVVRMTISLTVILIESTNNIAYGLPLQITLMVAKWVGDQFNESLYDIHIELREIPLLGWDATHVMRKYTAGDIMAPEPESFCYIESVGHVLRMLRSNRHHAFPIIAKFPENPDLDESINDDNEQPPNRAGEFAGMITRAQIVALLQLGAYGERNDNEVALPTFTMKDFEDRESDLKKIRTSHIDRKFYMDFRPFMNPNPFTVYSGASAPRVFNLFRTMGLRHLIVVDRKNVVAGIITRHDLVDIEH